MSTSGGSAWSEIDVTLDDGYAMAIPQGAVLQAGCWTDTVGKNSKPAVFRTTNDGATWQRSALSVERGVIRTMAVAPTLQSTVYAGGYSYDASSTLTARVFKSTDAGVTWTAIGKATFDGVHEYIEALMVDPGNAAKVLAGASGGVYMSTDAGVTWTNTTKAFYVRALVANTATTGRYYAGSPSGVWESTNSGQTWNPINNGLTTPSVLSLAFDGNSKKLFAGTDGGGVYRLDVLTDVPDEKLAAPAEFALEQNFPNPFNPSTVISCQVPVASQVQLCVYDLLGREVAVLADERKDPGVFQFTFDAAGLASGVYVYRLEAVGHERRYVASRTMILMK